MSEIIKTFMIEDFFHYHQCQRHRWCTLSCEYLREFSTKFKTALMVYSRAWGKLIHGKIQKSKISWHCPLKCASRNYALQNFTKCPFTILGARGKSSSGRDELEKTICLLLRHARWSGLRPSLSCQNISQLIFFEHLPAISSQMFMCKTTENFVSVYSVSFMITWSPDTASKMYDEDSQ